MNPSSRFLRTVVLHLIVNTGCFAARGQPVPALVNYQGQLAGASGAVIPTGDYTVEFRIFDASVGGTLMWGPQRMNGQVGPGFGPQVPVVQGWFNVMLGPVDSAGRNISEAFSQPSRFLEVSLGGTNTLAPRQQLLSVPYAFAASSSALALAAKSAEDSQRLQGLDWSVVFGSSPATDRRISGKLLQGASVEGDRIAESTIQASHLAPGSVRGTTLADAAVSVRTLDPEAKSGLLPKGLIAMWSGAQVPTGWALCDGKNGTPNLRDRFILGAGTQAIGVVGGSSTHTHAAGGLRMPSHTHSIPWVWARQGGSDDPNWIEEGAGHPNLQRPNATASPSGTLAIAGSTDAANSLPPFYTLAFIIKL